MTLKKRLIEWNLPLADISEESAREKYNRHGHPSTLHIWWARKPLAASRASALAALIDDPGVENPQGRKYLMDLINRIIPWDEVKAGNSGSIEEACKLIEQQYGHPPKVLDPFAGGGSIPLEAHRLGCEIYASDYNPVAVLIEKATLEWPQKFGVSIKLDDDNKNNQQHLQWAYPQKNSQINLLRHLIEKWSKFILDQAYEEIGHYYPNNDEWIPVGYYFNRTIKCQNPSCNAEIPLTSNFWLAQKSNEYIYYEPVIINGNRVDFRIKTTSHQNKIGFNPDIGTVTKSNARCLICGQITRAKRIRALARSGLMGERLIVVIYQKPGQTGKRYEIVKERDIEIYSRASEYLDSKLAQWKYFESPLPSEKVDIKDHAINRLPMYGMPEWKDIYNPRQSLAIITFMEKIKDNTANIQKDCIDLIQSIETDINPSELSNAIIGYLAIMLDRIIDYNSSLCILNSVGGRGVVHTLGRQALPISWDYIESNIFNPEGASWYAAINQTIKVIDNSLSYDGSGAFCTMQSATDLSYQDNYFDLILTDPPYYDSVPYGVLSDFFYVWLKRAIGEYFPELFSTPLVPKTDEAIMETTRHANKDRAKIYFEEKLSRCFREIRRVLKPGGLAVIIYAHKNTAGWEAMLNGLVNEGLVTTASWPIHTEMKARIRAIASASLASSIYMVCRKIEREPLGFWNEIQPRIQSRVEEKLAQFWDEGIAGGDFFISAIGPGMEEYSKYEHVETYTGEPVGVDKLLHFIRQVSTDFLVRRLLKNAQRESIDPEAQFYLTYRWTFLENKVPFDDANKIARAEGIDLEQYWMKSGFVKKSGSDVEVLGPHKRGIVEEVENMVDAMHRACQLWERGQKVEITRLLAARGYAESGAFWQFCQAVAECLINGSKEKQLLEGLLMGKDLYIRDSAEVVAEMKKTKPKQPRLFE